MKKLLFVGLILGTPLLLCACGARENQDAQGNAVVKVESGLVRGVEQDGVIAYKGIPYAAPPVGMLRWAATRPAALWTGIREASEFGADCMQEPFPSDAAPLGTEPAEDCLFINIWRSSSESTALQPVVVWIHGGGFVNGGSSPEVYSGHQYAQDGIVFVSFNYRLGRFGFFAHPALTNAEGGLGNYGYLDQLAALEWVQRNIQAFGGNPEAVTIMGESAGGGSVINLLTSSDAFDNFDRAIIMSGGGRGPIMGARRVSKGDEDNPSAESFGLRFAAQYGISGEDITALNSLRALTASQVTDRLNMASMRNQNTYAGGPLADGAATNPTQSEAIASAQFARVPVLIGTTSMDIGFNFATSKQELFDSFGSAAEIAQQAYDPEDSIDLRQLNMLVGADKIMHEPAHYFAGKAAEAGSNAWLYRFSYVAESKRNEWPGAPHATDIPFFLNTVAAKYTGTLTDQDQKAAEISQRYFSQFIKTGDPNTAGAPAWPSFNPESPQIMNITMSATAEISPDPLQDRITAVRLSHANK